MGEGAGQSASSRSTRQWGPLLAALPEEPEEVLVLNSVSGSTYDSLAEDAATADLVAFGARWPAQLQVTNGSNKRASGVLQLAFPRACRVYLLQLHLLERLPDEVRMMLANPEVLKVHFGQDTSDGGKLRSCRIALAEGTIYDIQGACAVLTGMSPQAPAEELRSLSLNGAASDILEHEMNSDESIVCSEWASAELTLQQICFASMEAWVTLLLFRAVYAAQYPQEFASTDDIGEEVLQEVSGSPCPVSDKADSHLRSRRPRPSSDAPSAAATAGEEKEHNQQRQVGKVLALQKQYYMLVALGFVILALVVFHSDKLLRLSS